MGKLQAFNIESLNLKVSPFLQGQGQVLRAVNVDRDVLGGWKKRSGYTTFLGTPDNSQVTSLFSWTRNDGTSLYLYRASGSILYHSVAGTGAWTVSPGGTITGGAHFGHTVLDDVLIGGDGTAASRHTTTGTSFSNTSGAPLAEHWEQYQGRVWGARGTATSGTNTDMFYSTVGTASDWTTDSSSIRIPGAGRANTLYKAGDRLVAGKDSGEMYQYDGYILTDLSTNTAPSSPYSIGEMEGYKIYLNRLGVFGHPGGRPDIISNPIERQIYNSAGSGITGTVFDNAPGIQYRYNWYCSVGTITDDLIQETLPDTILKYNFQQDEWSNYRFSDRPTAFGTYQDTNGNEQMIFGDNNGQCYQLSGTTFSDNGKPIESILQGFIHGSTFEEKKWNWITGQFNPGCKAKIQFAISDTFSPRTLNWIDVGDAFDGVVEYRFPSDTRGRFLHWKIYEASTSSRWQFFGWEFDADVIKR